MKSAMGMSVNRFHRLLSRQMQTPSGWLQGQAAKLSSVARVSAAPPCQRAWARDARDRLNRRRSSAVAARLTGLAVLGAVCFAALISACSVSSSTPVAKTPTPAAPGVLIPQAPLINLGNVRINTQTEAEFDLVNAGGQPVTIVGLPRVKVLEGCCPAIPTVNATVILPGGMAVVRYPYLMHTGAQGGPQHVQITVTTDSAKTPTIVLELTAVSGP
jgi:hypothetical protein